VKGWGGQERGKVQKKKNLASSGKRLPGNLPEVGKHTVLKKKGRPKKLGQGKKKKNSLCEKKKKIKKKKNNPREPPKRKNVEKVGTGSLHGKDDVCHWIQPKEQDLKSLKVLG